MPKASDISAKINATIPQIEELTGRTELFAAQEALTVITERVFTGASKDSNGNKLSGYSEGYAKRREKAGRQSKNKDLIFNGNLFNSVNVGTSNNKPVLGITNQRSAEIAGYLEEQEEKSIFVLGDKERQQVQEAAKDFLFGELRKIVKQWS